MKLFQHFVNLLFSRLTQHLHASFSEGANYSPAPRAPQGLFSYCPVPPPSKHSLHFKRLFVQPVAIGWRSSWSLGTVATSDSDAAQQAVKLARCVD